MGAATNAPVENYVDPIPYGVGNFLNLIEGRARTVELTAAVVRYHDPGGADVHGFARVVNAHDALQAERPAPFCTQRLGVGPVHRFIEHPGEVLADRHGNVRSLAHVAFQLRQFEGFVRKIVVSPARMQRERQQTAQGEPRR